MVQKKITQEIVVRISEKGLFTVSDFCALYSISRTTFYSEVRAGRLRITKRQSSTFVTRKNADDWIAQLEGETL